MEELIRFVLATSGMTYIITQSSLFSPLRNLFYIGGDRISKINDITQSNKPSGLDYDSSLRLKWYNWPMYYIYKMVTCPLCFGFWSGLIIYNFPNPILESGCIASIGSFLIYKLADR